MISSFWGRFCAVLLVVSLLTMVAPASMAQMPITQGSVSRKAVFVMSTTGLTVSISLSKNGGAFAAGGNATATEVGSTVYSYTFTSTDTNTIGPLVIKATSGGETVFKEFCVQALDVYDGVGAGLSRLDQTVGSRLATSGYTAPPTDYARNNVLPSWFPNTFTLSANDELALTSLFNSYTTSGGSVFKSSALVNAPTGGGGSFPTNFNLLNIDSSGKVALQAAEHTAIAGDLLNATVNGRPVKQIFAAMGMSLLGSITSNVRNISAKTITITYVDAGVTGVYTQHFSDTALTLPTTRDISITGLP